MFCFFFFAFSFSFQLAFFCVSYAFSLSLFFSAGGCFCFYSLRGDATRRKTTNNKHTNKDRKYITHKNCREDSMQVSCCFYLQTNSLSLFFHHRVPFFFLFYKNKCVVHNKHTKKRGKNVLLSIRHTIYESVYKTQTKRGKPLQKGIVIVQ
jgi:hypothetical protein